MSRMWQFAVGLVAAFNIVMGLGFLVLPGTQSLNFFLAPLGTQGMATLRADFTAFFLVGGACALLAVLRRDRRPLQVPLALLVVAIMGRAISLVADGAPATAFPPMVVEAVMIAVLALAWRASPEARS